MFQSQAKSRKIMFLFDNQAKLDQGRGSKQDKFSRYAGDSAGEN
jgi:hypothetical protein